MADLIVKGQRVEQGLDRHATPEQWAGFVADMFGEEASFEIELTETEKALVTKETIQQHLSQQMVGNNLGNEGKLTLALSLCGKLSNALSASLAIQMQIYSQLAQANTLAEVRAAMNPVLPLIKDVAEKKAKGEFVSVQHIQGAEDHEAILEALASMTQAALIIESLNQKTA